MSPREDQSMRLGSVRKWAAVTAGAVLVVGLLAFDPMMKVATALVALAVLQGLWRGCADIAAMLLGTVVALILATPLAPAFESFTASITGLGGIANRVAATLTAGLLVLLVIAVVASTLLRRFIRKREAWAPWDPFAGAGLGLVEGVILALAITWVPTALEPVARVQVASGNDTPAARFVTSAARAVETSALAGVSGATNPVKGMRLITLSGDAVEVLHNEAMREHFLRSEVMREIRDNERVARALDIIKADTQLLEVLDSGVSEDAVRALLNSGTVLKAVDETGVVTELAGQAPRLADAIEAAREAVRNPKSGKR